MNQHPTPEQISAFIDGEAAAPDRDLLNSHFESCSGCAATRARFERAVAALSALSLPEPTADQHRALRQAILGQQVKRHFLLGRPVVVGSLAVALLAAIAIASMRPSDRETGSVTAGSMGVEEQSFDFASDTEIRLSVASLPEVTGARYSAEDVGAEQEGAYSTAAGSSESDQPVTDASTSEESELSAGAGTTRQASGQSAGPGAYSQSAGTACSRKILKTQPYPMIPLLIRSATYKQQPAWLLVYAWTASKEQSAPLNQIQVWLIDPTKCAGLTGDDLINAAYHYSSFKRT